MQTNRFAATCGETCVARFLKLAGTTEENSFKRGQTAGKVRGPGWNEAKMEFQVFHLLHRDNADVVCENTTKGSNQHSEGGGGE